MSHLQDLTKTAKLNMAVLHFLAECGIPPSVIDSPAYKEMMQILTYHLMMIWMLIQETTIQNSRSL